MGRSAAAACPSYVEQEPYLPFLISLVSLLMRASSLLLLAKLSGT